MVTHLTENKRIARFINDHADYFRKMFYDHNNQKYPLAALRVRPVDIYSKYRSTGVLLLYGPVLMEVMTFSHACELAGLDYNLYKEELQS